MAIWKNLFGTAPTHAKAPDISLPAACDEFLVIGSPDLSEDFCSDLIISSKSLNDWIKPNLINNTALSGEFIERARRVSGWLETHTNNGKASTIPADAYAIVANSASGLVNTTGTSVRCRDCGVIYDRVEVEESSTDLEIYLEISTRWTCPRGHLLYSEDGGIHMSIAD